MIRWAAVGLLLLVGCANLQEARQRTLDLLSTLRVGESTIVNVTARFGPPQHVATSVTQAGVVQVYSYSATRMMIAASPPWEGGSVEATMAMQAGLYEGINRQRVRSSIVRFIFINSILTGVEQF